MKRVSGHVLMVAGLVLLLGVAPSWGQVPASNDISDGDGNTGGGTGALISVTTGFFNTAYGTDALGSNTAGFFNTASGAFALFNNTTGSGNTASGFDALATNFTGDGNTASGAFALFNNTTGSSNTASGDNALGGNATGSSNTATGFRALLTNFTGDGNTASGFQALRNNTTGSGNIAVGSNSGVNLTSGDSNIYLGSPGVAVESNTLRLGDPAVQTQAFIAGVATTAVTSGKSVKITPDGQLGVPVSSARYKRDIEALGSRSHKLFSLRPVSFSYKDDPAGTRQYGLIAEEVATVYPELVTRTATGEIEGVDYEAVIPLLLNELQQQQNKLAHQEQELAALKADQQQELTALQAQQDSLRAELLQMRAAMAPHTAALAGR